MAMKEKRSFFERLTGTVRLDDRERENERVRDGESERLRNRDSERAALERRSGVAVSPRSVAAGVGLEEEWDALEEPEAELTVDLYQTPDMIVVKAMIAGVRPEDLDVNITRDSVTIKGKREEERTAKEDDYVVKELYWGAFSRTIELPAEVNVDEAEAVEKHGLLILKLPKLDKKRQSKLKVRTI